jgi:manganese transport protein
MALSQRSHRLHEHAVGVLLLVVSLAFLYLLVRAQPASTDVLHGALAGRQVLAHDGMLALALGILGATVMPHNLFLHSGLVAERSAALPAHQRQVALQVARTDTRLSLLLATVVNAAILVVAAAALGRPGRPLDDLDAAHQALVAALGAGAGVVFAVALYAAGQSSAVTGVVAGRILSRGFAGRESRVWLRGIATRLAAICVAFALLALWPQASPDRLLVLSQCVLGMTLPFALVPMLLLAFRRRLLGGMAFGPGTLAMAAAGTALVLGLDGYLLATAF